jgi:hypothetical protein
MDNIYPAARADGDEVEGRKEVLHLFQPPRAD